MHIFDEKYIRNSERYMPHPFSSSHNNDEKKKKTKTYRVSFAAYKDVVMYSKYKTDDNLMSASQSMTIESELPESVSPPPQQEPPPVDLNDLITLVDKLLKINIFDLDATTMV